MINVKQAIVVEGKYDKIKLSSVVNGVILCTDGFRIFKDRDRMDIIRHYAKITGIIILTDSDSAGFKIRNHIKGAVGSECKITNVYIPDIFGKERRKAAPSKEGKLGVEGMSEAVLLDAFEKAGIVSDSSADRVMGGIDKLLLYELGYSGMPDSSARRSQLLARLGLPSLMTANALADILNTMMNADELVRMTDELFGTE